MIEVREKATTQGEGAQASWTVRRADPGDRLALFLHVSHDRRVALPGGFTLIDDVTVNEKRLIRAAASVLVVATTPRVFTATWGPDSAYFGELWAMRGVGAITANPIGSGLAMSA